jgi:hypothetical protein
VKLARAPQRLAGTDTTGALAGMVDDADGDVAAALQVGQMGQPGRDIAGDVLVE